MRIRWISLSVLIMLCVSTLANAAPQSTYYLALGDSLAIGIQPSAKGDVPTNRGYADDIFFFFRNRVPGLKLKKLGCSGETTATMVSGGVCDYGNEPSQLARAVHFLKNHHVGLVTLDVGANDIDHCISVAGIDNACVSAAVASVISNLPVILSELRAAAGPYTPIIAMNYYDPFLAAWALVPNGQVLAAESLQATNDFNSLLEKAYGAFSIPVANVAYAYAINDHDVIPNINLPVDVFRALAWTWMALPPPLGPDVHPNDIGYAAIALAFIEKIEVGH
ncbi:MAG: SGNH/GDSL hydrolase family protein [Terriglobales bacterium]